MKFGGGFKLAAVISGDFPLLKMLKLIETSGSSGGVQYSQSGATLRLGRTHKKVEMIRIGVVSCKVVRMASS